MNFSLQVVMATSGGTQDQDTADILCGICEPQHITNVLIIGVLNVKKGYVPNVRNTIACLKPQERMVLFQLKIIRNYHNLFHKLFKTAKTTK